MAQLVVLVANHFWIELAHGVKHPTRPHAGKHAFDVHASLRVVVRRIADAERARRSTRDCSLHRVSSGSLDDPADRPGPRTLECFDRTFHIFAGRHRVPADRPDDRTSSLIDAHVQSRGRTAPGVLDEPDPRIGPSHLGHDPTSRVSRAPIRDDDLEAVLRVGLLLQGREAGGNRALLVEDRDDERHVRSFHSVSLPAQHPGDRPLEGESAEREDGQKRSEPDRPGGRTRRFAAAHRRNAREGSSAERVSAAGRSAMRSMVTSAGAYRSIARRSCA